MILKIPKKFKRFQKEISKICLPNFDRGCPVGTLADNNRRMDTRSIVLVRKWSEHRPVEAQLQMGCGSCGNRQTHAHQITESVRIRFVPPHASDLLPRGTPGWCLSPPPHIRRVTQ